MYIYDKAHELAKLIQECEEYRQYVALRDEVYQDETTKALVKEYKKLQMQIQAAYMGGQEPDAESMEKLKKLGEVLQFNKTVTEFLMAEHRFYQIMGDIYKILGDAAEVELDFLSN